MAVRARRGRGAHSVGLTLAALALAALALACTQQNTGDELGASTAPQGLNRFLLFPNPVSMNAGGFETNTSDYADAYYRAIDPSGKKTTLADWMAENGFANSRTPKIGQERMAVFRDTKDLGYGRRMTGRINTDPADGSIAFFVENYNVAPNGAGGYASTLNVEAAIRRDTRWHVGTNAIEWSTTPCVRKANGFSEDLDPPDCDGSVKFAKYYNFSSKDGTRQVAVDLDGRGLKSMPGPCITCHGGRGDPLSPGEGNPSKARFPLVENSVSRKRGDVQARLHGMNVDSFGFSPVSPGFGKTEQQAILKLFNQWILCTYPLAAAPVDAEDACRIPAGANEWQGTAADMIKSWYGGPGMPSGTFLDAYVPADWQAGNPSIYTGVVAPYCRTCHILRGTKNQNDIDFMTVAKFQGYADRIKAHVFDRGTMPLALIVYNDFWNSSAPTQLASFINPSLAALDPPQTATDSGGAALRPGRPVASPGPDRMARTGTDAILSGEDSLFAGSYSWSMVSGSATVANPNSMITMFNAPAAGDYKVRLTVGNGSQADSKDVTITVDDSFHDPATLKFAHVKSVLQKLAHKAAAKCTDCHKDVAIPPALPAITPPIWYTDFDRNSSGGAAEATDDAWFLKALAGRVNLTDIQASPLLRKPSGHHHAGNDPLDLATPAGLNSYSILYYWILAGMPAGGVAANAGASTASPPLTLTFTQTSPGVFTADIPLDGSASVGNSLAYLWTATPPNGLPATFPTNASSASTQTTSLTVRNIGTYTANLQVTDTTNGETDTSRRTIVVAETPVDFDLTVAGEAAGTVQVPFVLTPTPSGTIGVTSAQTSGNPVSCAWSVGPTAVNPLATGVSLGANSCAGTTLNVTQVAPGNQYQVSMTEQNVSAPAVQRSAIFTVQAASGTSPSGANFTPIAGTLGWTINGVVGNTPTRTLAGATGITLTGSAAGAGTLTYSWAVTAPGAGCSIPAGASTVTTKVLSVTGVGSCDVTLTVTNSVAQSTTITRTVTISSSIVFSQVAAILGNAGSAAPGTKSTCISCHFAGGSGFPNWTTNGTVAGNNALRNNLAGEITPATPQSSRLLTCPNVAASCAPTMPAYGGFTGASLVNYDAFLTWIMNGQP